jgi:NAD(P)-dependent dehydrogenase (short-subunit alcohol dehydrogenase family)
VGFLSAMTQNVRGITQPLLHHGQSLPVEVNKNMIEGSCLKRMDQPEDIAKAIVFFASEDADFITGQLLLVNKALAFIAFTRRQIGKKLWKDSKSIVDRVLEKV